MSGRGAGSTGVRLVDGRGLSPDALRLSIALAILQIINPLRRLGLCEVVLESLWSLRFLRQGLQIRGLRARHRLTACNPIGWVLLRVAVGMGLEFGVVTVRHHHLLCSRNVLGLRWFLEQARRKSDRAIKPSAAAADDLRGGTLIVTQSTQPAIGRPGVESRFCDWATDQLDLRHGPARRAGAGANKGDLGRPALSGRLTRQYPGLWPCCGVSLGVVPTRTCLLIIHEGKAAASGARIKPARRRPR